MKFINNLLIYICLISNLEGISKSLLDEIDKKGFRILFTDLPYNVPKISLSPDPTPTQTRKAVRIGSNDKSTWHPNYQPNTNTFINFYRKPTTTFKTKEYHGTIQQTKTSASNNNEKLRPTRTQGYKEYPDYY